MERIVHPMLKVETKNVLDLNFSSYFPFLFEVCLLFIIIIIIIMVFVMAEFLFPSFKKKEEDKLYSYFFENSICIKSAYNNCAINKLVK